MLSDLRLGQYIPGSSLLHRLDPRTKLWCLILLSLTTFMIKSWIGLGVVVLMLGGLVKLSEVRLTWHLSSIMALWPVLVVTFLLNAFTAPGRVLQRLGPFGLTWEGIELGSLMAVRIALIVVFTSLFSLSTSPIQLTRGLERILRPLSKLGFPGNELALMMTIALRFVPTIIEEAERLIRASQARGGDISSGNLLKRTRALTPFLIPLLLGAFRRADDLALAMEARGYQTGVLRTSFRELTMQQCDYLALLLSTAIFCALLAAGLL